MTAHPRSQPSIGHTELPWSVGENGRSIVREVPGMSDGFDHYMVAVLSAHSLLPAHEASANAAIIVEAVNNYELLQQKLEFAEFEWNRATDGMKERDATIESLKARVAELEGALKSAFPHFQDDAPVTPETIMEIGRDWSSMVMNWMPVPREIKFWDQNGADRNLVWEVFEHDSGWVIPDDANWQVLGK